MRRPFLLKCSVYGICGVIVGATLLLQACPPQPGDNDNDACAAPLRAKDVFYEQAVRGVREAQSVDALAQALETLRTQCQDTCLMAPEAFQDAEAKKSVILYWGAATELNKILDQKRDVLSIVGDGRAENCQNLPLLMGGESESLGDAPDLLQQVGVLPGGANQRALFLG